MTERDDRPTRRRPSGTWALAIAVLVFTVVLGGGAWYALTVLRSLPGSMAEQGREMGRSAVEQVGELVRSFRTGEVKRRFAVHTTRVEGTNYLQVATLQQDQVYELEDSQALLWGTVELPPVVVRATAPVDYTYFVDLEGEWQFELREEERRILVRAPPLRWNRPAIDVSRLRWTVVRGSLLRDEHEVTEQLRRELMGRAAIQAKGNLPQVRETGRRQVERFVSNWLLQSFPAEARGYAVEVYFRDEDVDWQRAREPAPVPVATPG
jgi:hypothetical protein